MQYFKNEKGIVVLQRMVNGIKDNKGFLGDVDGLIGDGDHGMNMNKGFCEFEKRFCSEKISFSDGLNELGTILLTEIGGSMGPIYGTILMTLGENLDGKDFIYVENFADAMDKARSELFDIVEARIGDKTLVDCFSPACDVLLKCANEGIPFYEALNLMCNAALKGRDSTKDLQAKFGRSARLGSRSIGVLDAGACSCYIILKSIAEGILDIIEET